MRGPSEGAQELRKSRWGSMWGDTAVTTVGTGGEVGSGWSKGTIDGDHHLSLAGRGLAGAESARRWRTAAETARWRTGRATRSPASTSRAESELRWSDGLPCSSGNLR